MHVVLVGAWPDAFDALLASGHSITVLHENSPQNWERIEPYADKLAHTCVVDSYLSVESLWSAAHHVGADIDGVDAVIPLCEPAVVPAAILGLQFGARAIPPMTALRCRDKAIQKRSWQAADIPTAKHIVVTDRSTSAAALTKQAGMSAPFVVKPIAGMGAAQTFVVNDFALLDTAVTTTALCHPELARLLIEERNEGDEWIIDGMVIDGEIDWILLSREMTPIVDCDETNPIRILSFPPTRYEDWYENATQFARRAVLALGLKDSTFHFEVFGTPDGFIAGELGARPGGQTNPLVARMLGVNVWECAIKAITKDPIPPRPAPSAKVLGYIALPITPEKVNFVSAKHLRSIPGVVEIEMVVAAGSMMPRSWDNSSVRIGGAIVEGESDQECNEILTLTLSRVREINNS